MKEKLIMLGLIFILVLSGCSNYEDESGISMTSIEYRDVFVDAQIPYLYNATFRCYDHNGYLENKIKFELSLFEVFDTMFKDIKYDNINYRIKFSKIYKWYNNIEEDPKFQEQLNRLNFTDIQCEIEFKNPVQAIYYDNGYEYKSNMYLDSGSFIIDCFYQYSTKYLKEQWICYDKNKSPFIQKNLLYIFMETLEGEILENYVEDYWVY